MPGADGDQSQPTTLAQRTSDDLDEPDHAGRRGVVIEMVTAGAFDLAQDELDSVTVPTTSPESTQLAGCCLRSDYPRSGTSVVPSVTHSLTRTEYNRLSRHRPLV
jgi:hypothetical protein